MASFGMLPGNNAPTPVFGGTNPTGMLPGGFATNQSFGFPSYPMFGGTPSNGMVSPTANHGIFGMPSGTGIQGLSSGFGVDPSLSGNLFREFERAYGKGTGSLLDQLFTNGLFNPKVADAFLNAMQPSYNRGLASIEQAFGAEGARFGSAAALGIGDFSSQFALNEQQTLAQMYMQAQQNQLNLLENLLPTLHQEQADAQSGGWLSDLLGGLEIVGGIVGAPFTGGASLGMIPSGINAITGHGGSSGGGGGFNAGSGPFIPMSDPPGAGNWGGNNNSIHNFSDWSHWWLGSSAGKALGGNDSSTGDMTSLLPIV